MNTTATVIDTAALVTFGVTTYGVVLGSLLLCATFFTRRLHDFATECALERQRQNEIFERLLSMAYDYGEEEEEAEEHEN